MKIRLAIPKKLKAIAEEPKVAREQSYCSEVEIDVSIYDILKALKVEINENTKGGDILAKINELKSNKFNRIESIAHRRVTTGMEYKIVLGTGELETFYCFCIFMHELREGYLAIQHNIEIMKKKMLNNHGILLNESELKQIGEYIQKYNC